MVENLEKIIYEFMFILEAIFSRFNEVKDFNKDEFLQLATDLLLNLSDVMKDIKFYFEDGKNMNTAEFNTMCNEICDIRGLILNIRELIRIILNNGIFENNKNVKRIFKILARKSLDSYEFVHKIVKEIEKIKEICKSNELDYLTSEYIQNNGNKSDVEKGCENEEEEMKNGF